MRGGDASRGAIGGWRPRCLFPVRSPPGTGLQCDIPSGPPRWPRPSSFSAPRCRRWRRRIPLRRPFRPNRSAAPGSPLRSPPPLPADPPAPPRPPNPPPPPREESDEAPPPPAVRSLADLVYENASATTDDEETECLHRAVYCEANGEPLAGQLSAAE